MADINYNKTTWVNGSTALNAANLNNIEIGVDSATKAINNKVDKEAGKGLSTHDFNDHYKNAIDNLQDVEANPTESGTADLTKLKVGNTVYNIPSGSVFDLTPYLNFETMNIGTEGFNALIDHITNNKTPIVVLNRDGAKAYYTVSGCSPEIVICYYVTPVEGQTFAQSLTINSDGSIVTTNNANYSVEANPSETGTEDLTKLKVGSTVYNIPSIEIDTELNETSENPVQNKAVTTAITSLRERKYDQNNFQLRDGDYTSYQKDLSRIYRTEFNKNGEKTNVSYRIPVIKAGGSMGAGWKPFEGIKLDGQDYVFWLNNYKFGTSEEYKHTSSNFDYAEIQDLMYNGFRYRTQTIIDLDKLGFSDSRETLTDEIITMIKNGSNIVIIHGGLTYRDYTEDTDYYYFTCIDYKNHANDYWVEMTLRIGKNDNTLLLFYGSRHYFVDANNSTVAYNYLTRLKIGNTNYMISYVKANPSETGTADLTKLKVGNTVYNIPSGSVFDLTPYLNFETMNIGTEGFNALIDHITNNKTPIVVLNRDGAKAYYTVSGCSPEIVICYYVTPVEGQTFAQSLTINSDGSIVTTNNANYSVEANPSETGTEDLTKLKVGSTVYNIPSGGGSSGGGVNILELNDTDATAVGNAIDNLYSSDNDTTTISLTTPVDFSKTYQYISYKWSEFNAIHTIGKSIASGNTKIYWIYDKKDYFTTYAEDNKTLGLTLVVTKENGASTGTIIVARTCRVGDKGL